MTQLIMDHAVSWCFGPQVRTKNAGLGRGRFFRLDLLEVLKRDDLVIEEMQLCFKHMEVYSGKRVTFA